MKEIGDKNQCTGCGLCFNVCPTHSISMVKDDMGFTYPHIDTDCCIHCKKCIEFCPEINVVKKSKIKRMFAAVSINAQTRENASSGGVATEIAGKFMKAGGIVYGASLINNKKVVHTRAVEPEDIQKSKYVQSSIYEILPSLVKDLNTGNVLFIGTPCQVAAVKQLISYIKHEAQLYTVDILCHAVNSPGLFENYIGLLEEKNGAIVSYDFRNKKRGWKNPSVEIHYANGRIYNKTHMYDTFHNWFGKYYSVRESCYNCLYRSQERTGDITLGDFWGIDRVLPMCDYTHGVSRLTVNTPNGEELLRVYGTSLKTSQVDISKAEEACKNLFSLKIERPKERDAFWKTFRTGGIERLVTLYPPKTQVSRLLMKIKRRLHLK